MIQHVKTRINDVASSIDIIIGFSTGSLSGSPIPPPYRCPWLCPYSKSSVFFYVWFCLGFFFFFYCSFLQQQPPSCSRTFDLPDRKDVCTDMDNDDISSVGDSGITSIAHVDCSSPTSSLHAASQDAGEFLVIQPLHFSFCRMNHLHVHPLNRPKRFLW